MSTSRVDNAEDMIDSRDVIERIEWLRDSMVETDGVEDAELVTLLALAAEAGDYCEDWQYGATLIRDTWFVSYAQELAEDIGAIPENNSWPMTCIDWVQAARELQMDYTAVDFGGVTYWVR